MIVQIVSAALGKQKGFRAACALFGAVVGLIFAVLCLTIGVGKALLIGIFCLIGAFIGGVKDKKAFVRRVVSLFSRDDMDRYE